VSLVPAAVAAIRAGELVVLPTDTVYGLACSPDSEEAVRALAAVKGRSGEQPIALVAASIDRLLGMLPDLDDTVVRALLPGPYTLVVHDRAGRFAPLAGANRGTIGVRVPALEGEAADVLAVVGVVAATSANRHGEPDPRRLADVDPAILAAAWVRLDGGELPGTPSTVLDLTGPDPRVLREGAVPRDEALARVAAALAE
jgi:L-threonylcarbamoyladenylate synthase